jgi:hypothetical protein
LRTSGTATEHGRTLHSVQKQAAQLLSPSARRPADTTCDMLRGTCFAPMCTPCHCKHAARRPMVAAPPGACGRYRVRAAVHADRQRELAPLAGSCSQTLAATDDDRRDVRVETSSCRGRGAPSAGAPTLPDGRGHARRPPRSGGGLRKPPPLDRCRLDDDQNGLQKASKLVSSHTSRHWGLLFDGTTVDISIERSNLAKGIPCGPRGAMGPVRRARRGSRASLEVRPPTCNEFVTICTEYCYMTR